jgi:hypothetical protein
VTGEAFFSLKGQVFSSASSANTATGIPAAWRTSCAGLWIEINGGNTEDSYPRDYTNVPVEFQKQSLSMVFLSFL